MASYAMKLHSLYSIKAVPVGIIDCFTINTSCNRICKKNNVLKQVFIVETR